MAHSREVSGYRNGMDIRAMEPSVRTARPAAPRLSIPNREGRVVGIVRHAMIVIACMYFGIFCWSIYRRIWQVQRIELRSSSPVLTPGTIVSYDVVTSGEVQNRILLELVQGQRAVTLLDRMSRVSTISALDLRLFRYTPTVEITPELLARFSSGPATLRLTGFGAQKLLRTPAPRIRELPVTIR